MQKTTLISTVFAAVLPALASAQSGAMDTPPPVPGPYRVMHLPVMPRAAQPAFGSMPMPYWMQAPANRPAPAANPPRAPQYPAQPQAAEVPQGQPQFRFVPGWGWMPMQQGQGGGAPQAGWGYVPGFGQWGGYGTPPQRRN